MVMGGTSTPKLVAIMTMHHFQVNTMMSTKLESKAVLLQLLPSSLWLCAVAALLDGSSVDRVTVRKK